MAGTRHAGLDDASRYYASAAAIRYTPDSTPSDTLGRVVLSITVREYVGPAASVDKLMLPFPWQLDRVLPAVGTASSGGATGQTVFDIRKRTGGSSATLFTNGGGSPESRPLVPAGDNVGAEAFHEVTTGDAGDWLELDVPEVTVGGSPAQDLAVALVVYPR